MNLGQRNLTMEDRERLAFLDGQPCPMTSDDLDEHAEAMAFQNAATEFKGIDTPEQLSHALNTFHAYEGVLPDDVTDPVSLKSWIEVVTKEYHNLRDVVVQARDFLHDMSEPSEEATALAGDLDIALEDAVTL